jgi:hypothetical protein
MDACPFKWSKTARCSLPERNPTQVPTEKKQIQRKSREEDDTAKQMNNTIESFRNVLYNELAYGPELAKKKPKRIPMDKAHNPIKAEK